jgi:hypothetical protein
VEQAHTHCLCQNYKYERKAKYHSFCKLTYRESIVKNADCLRIGVPGSFLCYGWVGYCRPTTARLPPTTARSVPTTARSLPTTALSLPKRCPTTAVLRLFAAHFRSDASKSPRVIPSPQNKGPVHLGTGPTPCREHQKSRLRSGSIQEEAMLPPPFYRLSQSQIIVNTATANAGSRHEYQQTPATTLPLG